MFSIYLITNTVNNKIYIGVTNNIKKRMREHRRSKHQYALSRAIRKYGWEMFTWSILLETTDEEYAYNIAEKKFIEQYNSKNPLIGYNLTDGGGGTCGFIPSIETRELMRKKKIGNTLSEEHKAKISRSNKNRKFSAETRTKISKKLAGNKNFQGKTHSDETKKILSSHKAKNWHVISPDGVHMTINNMRNFCLVHNLHPSAMCQVMNGTRRHHKQWKKL